MALLSTPLQVFHTTPPATRAISVLILVLSLAFQSLQYRETYTSVPAVSPPLSAFPYLVLVPGSWLWFPWTLVTSAFVEINAIQLIFTLLILPFSLRYLERLWGTLETVKFVLITCTLSNVLGLVVCYAEYVVLGNPGLFLFGMAYHGQMGLQAAILVAFTQVIPEHQVQLFGALKMRVKQLPMLYVGFSNVMCIIGYQSPYILIQWGWLVGWIYLRFYKKTTTEGVTTVSGSLDTYGDRSETFAFVNWFPPFVHKPLGMVLDFVHSIALRLKVIPTSGATDLEATGYSLNSGNARAEAERRRAMALKALDQRMASNAAPPRAATPAGAPSAESSSRVDNKTGEAAAPVQTK
ncbi:hypothetical protein FRB96_000770 [Tulasnella sp. 330]|nr:hypothetical protein FRB96_000770 [Tulasnella sp. 330]KAG8879635.1 hypothetical protein FRB97_001546 [Tulasnella sp. 331]KAG8885926.1 hypothetical protein FRB98_001532 [Tulasnella sp. 332]